MNRSLQVVLCWGMLLIGAGHSVLQANEAAWQAGFSKADLTPQEPVRLSGYGNRSEPSTGVDEPLFVRGFALRQGETGPIHLLLSVDTIGFPGALTKEIHDRIQERHGIDRARFVICCTHSHTSPHITRGLGNLFSTPLNDAEQAAGKRYDELVMSRCLEAVDRAIADLKPARIYHGLGQAGFAQNRRVLKDGVWTGFGVNPDGPVDHSLPFLRVTDGSGQVTRGILFNYACHCTTFGGDYNRVNGDWAGYASKALESSHQGAVALCTIGCGADANPHRDSARAFELAQAQGNEIADEIRRLLAGSLTEVSGTNALDSSYGYAGLPIDRPTVDQLKESLKSDRVQVRQHAENMLAIHQRMGRLPETYPMPIQSWRFGDQFAMVFLGGEVCVDYGLRIKKEFSPVGAQPGAVTLALPVWVNAYANDVFGYVAPERMRAEGGYEVDFSMIYYNQPGRWSTGTEEVILRRVHELVENRSQSRPLSAQESLKTFSLAQGLEIDLLASEPLLSDPVNFAVGGDGRLWVVEMSDYPRGEKSQASKIGNPDKPTPWAGAPAGRIKYLTDTDGDGTYDVAQVFLDQLQFPNGVFPWRDGVLVSAAPDIFFARDTNGDGIADEREVLYTGFVDANPQHRVNGFVWGLDGWIYLASGAPSGEITCVKTGEKVNISGRDLRIHPDTNRLEPVSGRSQFGRCRDDFGNSFGNTNSEPLFAFAIEDRDLKRNPFVPSPAARVFQTTYAAPVFPTSRTVDRFNDLHALDRFTSACSPLVIRSPMGREADKAVTADGDAQSVLICEPVHNLVSRVEVSPAGVTFQGKRATGEENSEWLSSTDQWFRPVRTLNAPDGSVWVCDMYRQVIEHPQWIPEAWQGQLDLYAGSDRGRIYRVRHKGQSLQPIRDLRSLSTRDLVQAMNSPMGWQRDISQQLLIERGHLGAEALADLTEMTGDGYSPEVRVQAWWTLVCLGAEAGSAEKMLTAQDPRVVVNGIRAWGLKELPGSSSQPWSNLCHHKDQRVRYAVALAADNLPAPEKLEVLASLARQDVADSWMRAAILSSCRGVAADLLSHVLREVSASKDRAQLVEGLINTALGDDVDLGLERVVGALTAGSQPAEAWVQEGTLVCLDALSRRNLSLARVLERSSAERKAILNRLVPVFVWARTQTQEVVTGGKSPESGLRTAVQLLAREKAMPDDQDLELLGELAGPQFDLEVQSAAIESLARMGQEASLLARFREFGPSQRSQILTLLLSRGKSIGILLDRLEAGELSAQDLDASTRQAVTTHRDAAVRERAVRLLASQQSGTRGEVVSAYRKSLDGGSIVGNGVRGKSLFEKRCATCHKVGDIGTDLGPQLAALQNKSTEFLLTAILDPNQAVEPKYFGYVVETTDGRIYTGLILDENATSLILASADGKKQTLLRRDVSAMNASGKSFMPEGLEKDLSPAELADIVAMLQEIK